MKSEAQHIMLIWLCGFVWTLTLGLGLQLFILPVLLPDMHAGEGLILGGDWVSFHDLAVEVAERIAVEGWAAWELWPRDQGPAGVASLLYAATGLSHPALMLPVNAALFSLTLAYIYSMGRALFESRPAAYLMLLPFVLFPSFLLAWGQIHKDIFSGTGTIIILYALVAAWMGKGRLPFIALHVAAGCFLIWLMRGYVLEIVIISALAFLAIGTLCFRNNWVKLVTTVVALVLISLAFTELSDGAGSGKLQDWSAASHGEAQVQQFPEIRACLPLPSGSLVDRLVYSVCVQRNQLYVRNPAPSNFDEDYALRYLGDFIAYAPRALTVALFNPAPWATSTRGSGIGQTGDLVVKAEMTVAYTVFLAALVTSLNWSSLDRTCRILPILAFFSAFTCIFVYALPNLGTLYRMRMFVMTAWISVLIAFCYDTLRHRMRTQGKVLK